MKILMVCLGNICRSPLAEGIMQSKIDQYGLNWEVDSAGTSGHHSGEQPDPRSMKTAKRNGIDITGQRSRKIQLSDLDQFDLICAMDSSNYTNIRRLSQNDGHLEKIELIMNFVQPGSNINVIDPALCRQSFPIQH